MSILYFNVKMESKISRDPNNYRIHDRKNKSTIQKSLIECGAGRSILLDNDNVLIAGEGVYEQAEELGLKVRIIESDGTELIAVRRTDLSSQDEKRKLLALADNQASDTSFFDMELVLQDFDDALLEDLNFDIEDSDFDIINDLQNNEFAGQINGEADTFGFTLQIPKESKDIFTSYVKENSKAPIVEHLIKFVKNA